MQKKKWLNGEDLEKNRQHRKLQRYLYMHTHTRNLSKYLRTSFNKVFLRVESESM